MEGIAAARTRIEAIRARLDSLTPRRDFAAVLSRHTAADPPDASPPAGPPPSEEAVPETASTLGPAAALAVAASPATVPPVSAAASAAYETAGLVTAAATVTLGTMTGTGPAMAPQPARSTGIATRAALDAYLDRHGVEDRNGRLGAADLVAVSGAWKGTARLLPPAASAWEAMRAAAAADGIDLRAVDSYRSWESQSRAYAAHQRGEKKANVLPPGRSEHGHGLAVDVTNGHIVGPGDPEWAWLRVNARRFGWYPISNESWHWEFRGV